MGGSRMRMRKYLAWFVIAVLLLSISSTLFTSLTGSEKEVYQETTTIDETNIDVLNLKSSSLEYPFEEEYPSVEDLYDWYEDLEDEFPELIEKHDYGESYEGRDLYAWEITAEEDTVVEKKPSVLIDGALHAREWSTVPVATYFTWRLLDEYETNETINWVVNNRRIFVVPMVNPDGYIYDGEGVLEEREYWRKNRNDSTPTDAVGVDLNRNWDVHWEEGNDDPSSNTYHGEAPFSEPETYHLKEFMIENEIDSYQNLHSHWGTLLIPSTNMTEPTPHDDWYRGTADHMTSLTTMLGEDEQYSYGQPDEELGYGSAGSAIDWVYDEIGAQAYLYEIYTGEWEENFREGFYPHEEDIMTINEDLDDSLIYQTRVADTDLGNGEDLEYPPVPHLVYGTVEDEEGDPLEGIEVEVENRETGEAISINTNDRGYYELNFGNLVDQGYEIGDTFSIEIDPGTTRMNFDVDDSWGKRLDIEYSEKPQVTTEGSNEIEEDSLELLGHVRLGEIDSVEGYFHYRTIDEEDWDKTETELIEEDGIFEIIIDDLEPDEIYEFRAVIEWNEEEDFGETMTSVRGLYEVNIDSTDGGEVIEPGEGVFEYEHRTEIELKVSVSEGYSFVQWKGDVDTLENPSSKETRIEVLDNHEITAIFLAGEGTEEDPYLIEDVYDLQNMKLDLDANYRMTDDIDASETENWDDGEGFDPIGCLDDPFEGTFDGGGYKIDGLHIDRESIQFCGLFGVIGDYGEIRDLDLIDISVSGSHVDPHWVGGLAGGNLGLINNVYVSGDIASSNDVGGLVGQGPGTIRNSCSEGSVEGERYVGGLQGTSSGNIHNSYSSAKVMGTETVGGLVGGSWGLIENSYAIGEVSGQRNVGGLVGQVGIIRPEYRESGDVINSYSAGEVSFEKTSSVGGLVGTMVRGDVSDSFWNTESSGMIYSAGGTGIRTNEMTDKDTFIDSGWDFEEDWEIIEEETYPFLQWQEEYNYPYIQEPVFDLDIVDYDKEVEEGEEITVKYSVTFLEEIEEPKTIKFLVYDGEDLVYKEEREITSETEDEFIWTAEEEGRYEVVIAGSNNLQVHTVFVEEERSWIPLIIGLAVAGATVIIVFSTMSPSKKKDEKDISDDNEGVHLFSIEIQDKQNIIDSSSMSKIRKYFQKEDYDLKEDAELYEEDGKWWISEGGKKKYRVKKEDEKLKIYLPRNF